MCFAGWCVECSAGYVVYGHGCELAATRFADVNVYNIVNIVVVESPTIYAGYVDSMRGQGSVTREQASGKALSAVLKDFNDNFDFYYIFPCKNLQLGSYPSTAGASWQFTTDPSGMSGRADASVRANAYRGHMMMDMYPGYIIPMMHEMAHRWAVFLPNLMPATGFFGHWGVTVHGNGAGGVGQLGGYRPGFLTCKDPAGRVPTKQLPCTSDASTGRVLLAPGNLGLGAPAQGNDGIGPYGYLELLSMGLYSAAELAGEPDAQAVYCVDLQYSGVVDDALADLSCASLRFFGPADVAAALSTDVVQHQLLRGYNVRAVAVFLTDGGAECGAAPTSSAELASSANANALNTYVTNLQATWESGVHSRATLTFDVREGDRGCGLNAGCGTVPSNSSLTLPPLLETPRVPPPPPPPPLSPPPSPPPQLPSSAPEGISCCF